jgi:hypothetical protein
MDASNVLIYPETSLIQAASLRSGDREARPAFPYPVGYLDELWRAAKPPTTTLILSCLWMPRSEFFEVPRC